MKLEKTERLITLLKQSGVTYFKDGELEIRLDGHSSVSSTAPLTSGFISTPPSFPLQAVPPVETEIPHHVNEVQNLLKLSDEDLVDKLFPDYSQIKAEG